MLVKYKNDIFDAYNLNQETVTIRKYVEVDGFEKVDAGRGITFYKKIINISEIEELFSVQFLARLEDMEFSVHSFENGHVSVISNSESYAEKSGFRMIERGAWIGALPFEEFDTFIMIRYDINTQEREFIELQKEEFIQYWKIYVEDIGN